MQFCSLLPNVINLASSLNNKGTDFLRKISQTQFCRAKPKKAIEKTGWFWLSMNGRLQDMLKHHSLFQMKIRGYT